MSNAILSDELSSVEYKTDEIFNLAVPQTAPDVKSEVLDPRASWADQDAFTASAKKLAELFITNYNKYATDDMDFSAGGPNKA